MKDARYPLATTIAYGPDHKTATKLVVSIFKKPGQRDPSAMEKWYVQGGDIRQDTGITDAVHHFVKKHHAAEVVAYDRILGCPHQEGIDYPLGGTCPHCPFWANVDRRTLEPLSLDRPLTAEQILAGLSCERDTQPLLSYAAAEKHREILVAPFLQAIEHGLNNPVGATAEEATLFSYALAFLGKWREPRLYPLLIRLLSLPGNGADDIVGDTVSQWGSRLLAMVCGDDLEPVKQLIVNRQANKFCRWAALDALALLVAWEVRSQAEIAEYFGWLVREGLEREPNAVWGGLACACLDIEAVTVFEALQRAYQEDLIDPTCIAPEKFETLAAQPRGLQIARVRDQNPPFEDIAKETEWWGEFKKNQSILGDELAGGGFETNADGNMIQKPFIAPPKVGRNDPCPCGSGKKYKKCCGA